jgi:hypothetical protein
VPKRFVEKLDDFCVTLHNSLLSWRPAASANSRARTVANIDAARCQCRQHIWPQLYRRELDRACGVHRAGTAGGAAYLCTVKRFVDDLADRARATAALGAAAEAAIDMAR